MPDRVADDVRPVPFWARFGPPRNYSLTRWLVLRLLGVVYAFAFLGIVYQALPLIGSHGLTPVASYVDHQHALGETFWDRPSLLMLDPSDAAIQVYAYIGLVLAVAVVVGYANLPMLLALWVLYGSFERCGQLWWGFGWEIQLLETGLICAFLAHPWDPRPLAARPPPITSVVLLRWLVFRIMLGAGLIKLRGDPCWRDLTCLDGHFETQPIPNPLSRLFHDMGHTAHAVGVVVNHIVELGAPWFVFGPRRLRIIAGCAMLAFQCMLIASGNLAFLNWLTVIPVIACFDDDCLLWLLPKRARTRVAGWIPPKPASRPLTGWQIAVGLFAALVAVKSIDVVANLASDDQAMNLSYDRLALVNTYGAFGSVGMVRHELVIEGTLDTDPAHATWREYELPCKPGDVDRRPCVLGPYHRRLDWLIWFAAMEQRPRSAWMLHLVWKLLDGDTTIRQLIAVDPFAGAPPRWVRVQRFRYRFAPSGGDGNAWWIRDEEAPWLPPLSLDSPELREELARFGWPSPSAHE